MRASSVLLAVVFGVTSSGCAPRIATGSRLDPELDLSGYRSFVWEEADERPSGDPRLDNDPFFDRRFHAAVQWEPETGGIRSAALAAT